MTTEQGDGRLRGPDEGVLGEDGHGVARGREDAASVMRVARLTRMLVLASIVIVAVLTVFELLYTFDEYAGPEARSGPFLGADLDDMMLVGVWDATGWLDGILAFAFIAAFAVWFARVARIARARGADVPEPVGAGVVQFFFPLTLHFPYRHLARAARTLDAGDAVRPALLMYLCVLPSFLIDLLYEMDGLAFWLMGDIGYLGLSLAESLLTLVVLDRVTRGAAQGAVADVFA